MDSQTTKHFGRYEILGELGRGSMGVVYKARDPQIDRLVAIKTISVLTADDEDAQENRQRFFLEARAAGRLSHPGIVTIYDVGEEPESHAPYIVMEYVPGKSLQKMLAEQRKLPLNVGLQLALELAEALDYAHAQGVVHRDMKPANILVTEDGHTKIADFGIAKLNLAQLTVNGHVLGTPAYMAPEQLEGERVDGRADLFSLGVILYAMLTGHRPFQGNSAATVSFKVVNREPVPATAFDAEFPPEVDYVINRAMSKNPAQRYQTGREMALDISELSRGRVPRSKGDPGTTLTTAAGSGSHSFLSSIAEWTGKVQAQPSTSSQSLPQMAGKTMLSLGQMHGKNIAAMIILSALVIGYLAFRRSAAPAQPPQQTSTNTPSAAGEPTSPVANASTAAPAKIALTSRNTNFRKHKPKQAAKPQSAPVREENESAAVVATRPTAVPSTLSMRVDHPFTRAKFSVSIDGQLSFTHSLTAVKKKKLVFFKGGAEGSDNIAIPVAAGKHRVKVRVQSADGKYDETQSISADFAPSGETVLHVRCDERNKKLEMTME